MEPAGPAVAGTGRTPRDLALSLGVLLVPIAVLLIVYRWLGGESATVLDAGPTYDEARTAHVFTVLEPAGLPSGWQVASAQFRRTDAGAVLRVGYRAPGGTTAQLVESDGTLASDLSGGRPDGNGFAGRQWQWYRFADGARALVRTDPGRTVAVLGRGDAAQLAVLAGALR
jgi:hypothetical protein